MRAMPNMTVVAPCDNVELAQLMDAMMEYDGPVYFRVTRNPLDRIVPGDYRFAWGRGVELKAGRDVTIVGTGIASQWALEAAHELQKAGIDARAIHMPCLKPFDKDLLVQAARETGAIVTVENHSIIGGLGGVAAETLSEEYPVPIQRVGVNDCFVETGDDAELIEKCGLSLVEIMGAARKAMAKKAR
jgi:transketolase